MKWDDDDNLLGKQVRDNKGKLIGWIKKDPLTGGSHVYDQNGTVGWTKPHDKSGPGWSISSKDGRVAHTNSPEYLLALKKQKEEAERQRQEQERQRKDQERRIKRENRANRPGADGSDPEYRR